MTGGRFRLRHILLPSICLLGLLLPPAVSAEQYWVYTVRPGDTIWHLTNKHCTSVLHWKRIQRLNGLPDVPARGILPGTRLKFPIDILKHQPASATVSTLQGEAQIIKASGSEQAVAVEAELHSGDRLQVGEHSTVMVRFADGSELLVLEGSDVVFDSLSAYGETGMVDTRIRLQSGQVDTRVKKRKGPGSRYEIITPAAVAAVRGTDFRVAADSERPVGRSEVLEGAVDVSGAGGSQRVPSGFGVLSEAGKPPGAPRPLLPAPDLSPQQELLDRLPLQFQWAALEKADAYRFQVAASEAFDGLLANDKSPGTRGYVPDLPNGEYVLRVRGIDPDGLEGLNAMRRFTVAAHPQPPVLIGLNDNVVVRDATPEFGWSKPVDIDSYSFQLARDDGFTAMVADESAYSGDRYTPGTDLSPGGYYWRVASIDANGMRGPWSDVSAFEYRAIPDSPEPEVPALGEDVINFHWRDAGADVRYNFQLDSEPEFPSPSIDLTVTEPRLAVDTPVASRYYFRVRAIDESGYAGPWSTTQTFTVPGNPWQLLVPAGLLLLF